MKTTCAKIQTLWPTLIALTVIQTGRPVLLALRIRSVEVPSAVANGTQVTLVCNYELSRAEQLESVKWYRNYVEFYRFQLGPASSEYSSSSPGEQEPQQQQQASNLKNEFELEGINLDLNKSNGTHVHLRQVSLASEATYKCEVSADSPTFATVSLERQMKVYVLPKQKLTILDNNNATTTTSNTNQDQQQQQSHKVAYQLNDLVNFTCLAGPSRPAAKLTWLVNDQPIASASKWLSSQQIKLTASGDLVESRLTLAFKLQLSHLTRSANVNSHRPNSNNNNNHRLGGLYPIKLSCVAKLSVEFSSETSILVSGGKTLIKRRQQQEPGGLLPLPSSLVEPAGSLSSSLSSSSSSSLIPEGDVGKLSQNNGNKYDHYYPIYRWPRPPAWQASSLAPPGGSESSQQEQVRTTMNRNGRQIMVWTSRQLKAQAEHIDQMLRKSHPNDLSAPLIEAKAQLSEEDEESDDRYETTTTRLAADDQDTTTTTTDPLGQMDEATRTTTTEDPMATGDQDRRSSSSLIKDYELNEQVQFACTPQVGPYAQELARSVHVRWLINDKEINGSQVNAFDGSKFYHEYRERRGQSSRLETTTIAPVTTTTTTISDEPGFGIVGGGQSEPGHQVKMLSVELTPNLFQLKELNLKCRTIVEQPLIEYESHVVASVSTSPFIQVDQNQQQSHNPNIKFRPSNRGSSYHKYSRHNSSNPMDDASVNSSATPRSRHKNNERYRSRLPASSSSAASGRYFVSPLVGCLLLTVSSILTIQLTI